MFKISANLIVKDIEVQIKWSPNGIDAVDIQAKLDEDLKMVYDNNDDDNDANGKLNWNAKK